MSDRLKPGDRVVVKPFFGGLFNRYNSQHGKVVSNHGNQVTVRFDDEEYGTSEISKDILSLEELTQQQVIAEIDKIKNLVENKTITLTGDLKTELPNHLKYLRQEAQASDINKDSIEGEVQYIAKKLQAVSKANPSEAKSWWNSVKISLEKTHWNLKLVGSLNLD